MGAVEAENAGKGKRALAAELQTKGVDNDVITAALADIDPGAEHERAERLVATSSDGRNSAATTTQRWRADSSGCWPVGVIARRWHSTW